MFQTFSVSSDKTKSSARLKALRDEMAKAGIDAFLVPHADEYQNEYLPPRADRLAWLTGFTGSAGTAIILKDQAHIFVDGRYTLQVRDQIDLDLFTPQDLMTTSPDKWLADNLRNGNRVGFDPWLHTIAGVKALEKVCDKAGATAIPLPGNPIDTIWKDQPPAPDGKVSIHPLEFAGVTAKLKLQAIAKDLRSHNATATVLTDTSSIAWAFNIRGSDVDHTPLALAFAIVPAKGQPKLFVSKSKLGIKESAYLTQLTQLFEPDQFETELAAINGKVQIDFALAAKAIANAVEAGGGTVVDAPDPCRLPRASKNRVERAGAIAAHKRDGAAMATFLCWLDEAIDDGEQLDEIQVAKTLEAFRAATGTRLKMPLKDISFDTISGSGPNGAIVHYRVNEETNRTLKKGDLLLVDSGGQYEDGTTDITRVIPVGEPTDEYRRHFTLVLKGMIAISESVFPKGTRGIDLDTLARRALWEAGLDYAHGTGHGVGAYLSVHEGPQGISRRSMTPFETGMIVSNEPGYYKTGSHGIRIENLLMVEPPKVPKGGQIEMHSFRTLTLCPIDTRLVDRKLLTVAERRWLNRYHARVRREISPLIDDKKVLAWLERATARL